MSWDNGTSVNEERHGADLVNPKRRVADYDEMFTPAWATVSCTGSKGDYGI